MNQDFDTVVGLEVHIQMNTQSKAFCGDANSFGQEPNINVSAISLAHPGTLPVANVEHIEKAIQLGIALDCRINETNFFDRKHYFYPDLPKGYQITQDAAPICLGGELEIEIAGLKKIIYIHHIHMEEDAGKNVHDQDPSLSLIDLNRAGTPLLELVTEPCLSSGEEVFQFILELQKLLRFIGVSDADMEKGSMRCDCNVSIKPKGIVHLGERCEIKNLNSKRFAREAVKAEAKRQIKIIKSGGEIVNQTLHYDADQNITYPMREKEGLADYRYFPDPDLPPIQITNSYLEKIKSALPLLPAVEKQGLLAFGMTPDYADQLTQSPNIIGLYHRLVEKVSDSKAVANLIVNLYLPSKKENENLSLSDDQLLEYLTLIHEGVISSSVASQELWPELVKNPKETPRRIAKRLKLLIQKDEGQLKSRIHAVLVAHPDQVKRYKSGKKALIGFFIGAVMKDGGGKVDPQELKKQLLEMLSAS